MHLWLQLIEEEDPLNSPCGYFSHVVGDGFCHDQANTGSYFSWLEILLSKEDFFTERNQIGPQSEILFELFHRKLPHDVRIT